MTELRSSLVWSDVLHMVAAQEPESRNLEFKREVDDADELRRDVTALANAGGGHLVFGVLDGEGKAGALAGLTPHFLARMKQRGKELLAQNIEPPVSVELRILESPLGDVGVLIIEVPSSPQPHAVEISQDRPHEYWTRRGDSKRPMRPSEVQKALVRAGGDESAVQTALTARALWELRMMGDWKDAFFDRPKVLSERLSFLTAIIRASNRSVAVTCEVAELLSLELTDRVQSGGTLGGYRLAAGHIVGLLEELPVRSPKEVLKADAVWAQAAEFGHMLSYPGSRRLGGDERGQQLIIALGVNVLAEVMTWGTTHGIPDAVRVANTHLMDQRWYYEGALRECFDFALNNWVPDAGLAAADAPQLLLDAVFEAPAATPIVNTRRGGRAVENSTE